MSGALTVNCPVVSCRNWYVTVIGGAAIRMALCTLEPLVQGAGFAFPTPQPAGNSSKHNNNSASSIVLASHV
eukprot:CAMPEP_0113256544 /NCGR_PEP_ID=MMETSP0008_2-20120614/14827_1 /TAXON_ID=97485 /ORGANISM="Prymnesium parvum" /LENGTH=71 /DNA_ID=CAMNT_0000104907 /DNA_START=358 /DNA_END=573 /DNA_ORIENTATION=- /assembly_acc=CAM_ASM_000153